MAPRQRDAIVRLLQEMVTGGRFPVGRFVRFRQNEFEKAISYGKQAVTPYGFKLSRLFGVCYASVQATAPPPGAGVDGAGSIPFGSGDVCLRAWVRNIDKKDKVTLNSSTYCCWQTKSAKKNAVNMV